MQESLRNQRTVLAACLLAWIAFGMAAAAAAGDTLQPLVRQLITYQVELNEEETRWKEQKDALVTR